MATEYAPQHNNRGAAWHGACANEQQRGRGEVVGSLLDVEIGIVHLCHMLV